MASQKAAELSAVEQDLKRRGRRRLIGAITLGLLAVVFLPMIFDSKPKESKAGAQEISIRIPPKDGLPPLQAPVAGKALPEPKEAPKPAVTAPSGAAAVPPTPTSTSAAPTPPAVSTVTPVESKAIAKVEVAPAPAPAKSEPAKKPEPPKVVAKVEPKPEPKIEPKPEPKADAKPAAKPTDAKAAAAPKQGFVIQVGAFKDADNAQQIATKTKELKLPVYTDTVATTGGSVTRVRVGPFATREKADSALVQVKLSGADGKIVPLP
jgi:DedD protein